MSDFDYVSPFNVGGGKLNVCRVGEIVGPDVEIMCEFMPHVVEGMKAEPGCTFFTTANALRAMADHVTGGES